MVPPTQQWPRGPSNELHGAACDGSTERTIALLSMGSININQGAPTGYTPLMFAAMEGHSPVARILLSRGADVSIAADDGVTALHLSSQYGHLAVTVDLVKAGAELDAKLDAENVQDSTKTTPLSLAALAGHSEVMAALIEAGANVDSDLGNNGTVLYSAAVVGCLDVVKELLRAKANPLLAVKSPSGKPWLPLDMAAHNGHSEVARELVQQVGIEGCGGASGGEDALQAAAEGGHVAIMAILMGAGVVDTGKAQLFAAGFGRETSMKFLLQQQRRRGATVDYVNTCDPFDGRTPLFRSIDVLAGKGGVPRLISPKVVRLLIDAGADTSSAVRVTKTRGDVLFNDTPLAFTNDCLRKKKVGVEGIKDATEEQMYRLGAVRRLLLRVEAVHAVSWLWLRDPLLVGSTAEVSTRTNRKTAASGAQLRLMLPILKRRRRGVLLVPLFRYSRYP